MEIIAHRKNLVSELLSTKTSYGVEVDIRSNNKELILSHDPFVGGESFAVWLKSYAHGTLILNVKEEGLEQKIIDLMKEFSIKQYFFLDMSFPFLVKWANQGERKVAVRFSEYESIETVKNIAGKIDWVWIDCFTTFPLNFNIASEIRKLGFKICLVSPELQGQDPIIAIPSMKKILAEEKILADAVCTKRPDLWI